MSVSYAPSPHLNLAPTPLNILRPWSGTQSGVIVDWPTWCPKAVDAESQRGSFCCFFCASAPWRETLPHRTIDRGSWEVRLRVSGPLDSSRHTPSASATGPNGPPRLLENALRDHRVYALGPVHRLCHIEIHRRRAQRQGHAKFRSLPRRRI